MTSHEIAKILLSMEDKECIVFAEGRAYPVLDVSVSFGVVGYDGSPEICCGWASIDDE